MTKKSSLSIKRLTSTPVLLLLAGLLSMACIAAIGAWRLQKTEAVALESGKKTLREWSKQLGHQLEAERTAWRPVLAILTQRHVLTPDVATELLSSAQRSSETPLHSSIALLDDTGLIVASSVPASVGMRVNLPAATTLTANSRLLSLQPVRLPWEGDGEFLTFGNALPTPVAGATVAVQFLSANKLKAVAASVFEGKQAQLSLSLPGSDEQLQVSSLGFRYVSPGASPATTPVTFYPPPAKSATTESETAAGAPIFTPNSTQQGWLTVGSSLPGLGALVLVQHSLDEVTAEVRHSTRPAAIFLVTVLCGLVWTILGVAGRGHAQSLRARRNLEVLVGVDALTQLPNRRSFTADLKSLIDHQKVRQNVGLMFIDLDNFKYINDTFGHDAGDDLLCEVARRLGSAVRKMDKVYRLGGDEFTVVLPGVDSRQEVERIAQRVLTALTPPLSLRGGTVYVSASVGAACSPLDASTSDQLVRCADLAVYAAKARGKSCYASFDTSLKTRAELLATMGAEIRAGLKAGEFHLVYQPKLHLGDGAVSGFEALLRWQHPARGLVAPSEFIPFAEESSLIKDLGCHALELAVKQLAHWRDQGIPPKVVAVNMSAVQLRDDQTVRHLESLLARHRVPGEWLQLEVTETALTTDMALAIALISKFKELGVSIAVDDFGTGYSSLAALQKFKVDYLKIDKSFVDNLGDDRESLEICKAVIALAHALQIRVIAEGVESFVQHRILLDLGCDEAQGYLFSRPREPDDAIAWHLADVP